MTRFSLWEVAAGNPTETLGRFLRSATWMGTGPAPAKTARLAARVSGGTLSEAGVPIITAAIAEEVTASTAVSGGSADAVSGVV